jgi:hypothetical protein
MSARSLKSFRNRAREITLTVMPLFEIGSKGMTLTFPVEEWAVWLCYLVSFRKEAGPRLWLVCTTEHVAATALSFNIHTNQPLNPSRIYETG